MLIDKNTISFLSLIIVIPGCAIGQGTPEARMKIFKNLTDTQIGEPFYFSGPENTLCTKHLCKDRGDGYVEYTIKEKEDSCEIIWIVDKTKKGKYSHPTNGMVFEIAGIKTSWYYKSDPILCQSYYGYAP